ncbi:MAG: thioredoxin family protein [Akkermansiaceae bacterium]|nr:thioredoxin family protein [Akkermansiaceae bacterium]
MKAITWLASVTVGVAALSASAFAKVPEGWSTDLDKALEKAKAEKKSVLVEFTGSDWCPPCIAMRKNVFTKKEFVSAASKDFILVELDFPNGDEATKKKNEPMATKYKIEGFPTVILLNSAGKEFSRFFASEHPSVDGFLKHINGELKKRISINCFANRHSLIHATRRIVISVLN